MRSLIKLFANRNTCHLLLLHFYRPNLLIIAAKSNILLSSFSLPTDFSYSELFLQHFGQYGVQSHSHAAILGILQHRIENNVRPRVEGTQINLSMLRTIYQQATTIEKHETSEAKIEWYIEPACIVAQSEHPNEMQAIQRVLNP